MRDCITGSIIWCCNHLSSFTILEKLYIFPALSSPSPSSLRLLNLWLGQCRDQLVRHPQPEKWHGGLRSPPWLSIIAVKNICDCRGEYPFTDRLFNSNTDCAMGMPDSFKISHTCRFFLDKYAHLCQNFHLMYSHHLQVLSQTQCSSPQIRGLISLVILHKIMSMKIKTRL